MSRIIRKKKSVADSFVELMLTKPTILVMAFGTMAAFILFG